MFGNNDDNGDSTDDENDNGIFGGVYDFLSGDDDSAEAEEDAEPEPEREPEPEDPNPSLERWSLGDHEVSTGLNADQFDESIEQVAEIKPGLADILSEAQDMMAKTRVSRFECGVCGLGHTHDDTKHDIRGDYEEKNNPGFSIENDFAESMEFSPYCHCGVNELAMLIDFYGHLPQPVFADQHRFEGVLEVNNESLITYCQARRDLESEAEFRADVTLDDIAAEAKLGGDTVNLLDELGEETDLFYERWRDIKRGGNGAPIAGETRQAIANLREFIEAEVDIEDEPEADEVADNEQSDPSETPEAKNRAATFGSDDDTYEGVVNFYNATGSYGFIEVEDFVQEVFFHLEGTGITHLHEGTEVTLSVKETTKGPQATDLAIVEDDEDDDEDEREGTGAFGNGPY